jgi:hypothetical protein
MDFVQVASFGSRLEAETVGHALDQYGIPFVVKSEDTGFYGPGAESDTIMGATLWVPDDQLESVKMLLRCVIKPPDESTPS